MKRLKAIFRPQQWISDNAVDTGETVEFDATAEFLSFPLDTIRSFKEHTYLSDDLATNLRERWEHQGPFEVDVDVDEWLEDNTSKWRAQLSEDDLQELRKKFDVDPSARRYRTPKDRKPFATVQIAWMVGGVWQESPRELRTVFDAAELRHVVSESIEKVDRLIITNASVATE